MTPSCKDYRRLVDEARYENYQNVYGFWRYQGYSIEEIELVKTCQAEMQEALIGATTEFSQRIMASMRSRYANSFTWKDLSSEQLVHIALEWVEDLSEYPEDLITEAYRLWRQGKRGDGKEGTRKGEPPRDVGELMSCVSEPLKGRRSYLSKAEGIIAVHKAKAKAET